MTLNAQYSDDGSAGGYAHQDSDGLSFRILGTKKSVEAKRESLPSSVNFKKSLQLTKVGNSSIIVSKAASKEAQQKLRTSIEMAT